MVETEELGDYAIFFFFLERTGHRLRGMPGLLAPRVLVAFSHLTSEEQARRLSKRLQLCLSAIHFYFTVLEGNFKRGWGVGSKARHFLAVRVKAGGNLVVLLWESKLVTWEKILVLWTPEMKLGAKIRKWRGYDLCPAHCLFKQIARIHVRLVTTYCTLECVQ